MNLYTNTVGKSTVDSLINNNLVYVKTGGAYFSGETGETYKRGLPLEFEADGKVIKTKTAIFAILLDDVTVIANEAQEVAVAYTGEFNQNIVEDAFGEALSKRLIQEAMIGQIYIAEQNEAKYVQF